MLLVITPFARICFTIKPSGGVANAIPTAPRAVKSSIFLSLLPLAHMTRRKLLERIFFIQSSFLVFERSFAVRFGGIVRSRRIRKLARYAGQKHEESVKIR